MSAKRLGVIAVGVALAAVTFQSEKRRAEALPMFARRLGVSCSTCHTSPPRLNETGYKFRAAGFRMPNEIGRNSDERLFKPTDYIGFRLQPRYDVVHSRTGDLSDTVQKGRLFAAEGYLWFGPISKYFSSNVKITMFPEESNETELTERVEGTLRFTYGNENSFFDLRAGVPHTNEGFGGSEYYVLSNTRPFIQELRSANFNQDTFFAPLGFHQAAVIAGYYHNRTTISGQVSAGIRVRVDDDGNLEPFGRKEPVTKALAQGKSGGPDFKLFFNQILHDQGGNLSVYYYNGRSRLPRLDLLPPGDPGTTDPADHIEAVPFFKNDFHRLAFYAGYPIGRVNLLYGIQHGRDKIGAGGHFDSMGQFAEGSVRLFNDISAVGARFDRFDPARNKDHNELTGVTAYLNLWLHNELRLTPEYQHLFIRNGPGLPSRTEDRFQLRLYWVR
jgi:hypothetical protein